MMQQAFHRDMLKVPVFEKFLQSGLMTGAIPLPLAKYWKFNAPSFTGRRWEGVDPVKEMNAYALALANKLTSLQRIHDERGTDLEQTLFEIAESNMLMEEFGISTETTQGPMVDQTAEEADAADAAQQKTNVQ
jgi:capsid protein